MRLRLLACLAFAAACLCHSLSAGEGVQIATSRAGMVVAAHPPATEAGLAILEAGGNAVDAAIAVSLALGVAEPHGSGLGGKLEWVCLERASGKVSVISALDSSGPSFDVAAFRDLSHAQRREGGASVAVPGLPAGLMLAHERWGSLPRETIFAPAIRLAREGFEVLPGTTRFFQAQIEKLRRHEALGRVYLDQGEIPAAGSRVRNKALARTLHAMVARGAKGFYEGPVAEAIAAAIEEAGGFVTTADLAAYRATIEEPLRVAIGDCEIVGAIPPAHGAATFALTVKILETHAWAAGGLFNPENTDAFLRACQQADGAVRLAIGDTPDAMALVRGLFTEASIAALREAAANADPASPYSPARKAAARWMREPDAQAAETTHFCVVDAEGNAVSATQSLSHHFGSGILVPDAGVILNNTLVNFALSGGPNVAAANKRPRTTIAPSLIFRDGKLATAIGLPGGARIPSGMAQVVTAHLLLGADLAAAIAAPRVHPDQPNFGSGPHNVVWVEELPREDFLFALRSLGWAPEPHEDTESFGGLNAIEIGADGVFRGIADLRRPNHAAAPVSP